MDRPGFVFGQTAEEKRGPKHRDRKHRTITRSRAPATVFSLFALNYCPRSLPGFKSTRQLSRNKRQDRPSVSLPPRFPEVLWISLGFLFISLSSCPPPHTPFYKTSLFLWRPSSPTRTETHTRYTFSLYLLFSKVHRLRYPPRDTPLFTERCPTTADRRGKLSDRTVLRSPVQTRSKKRASPTKKCTPNGLSIESPGRFFAANSSVKLRGRTNTRTHTRAELHKSEESDDY